MALVDLIDLAKDSNQNFLFTRRQALVLNSRELTESQSTARRSFGVLRTESLFMVYRSPLSQYGMSC